LKPEVYSFTVRVLESAIDDRNHVNNLKYLEWCLEAASRHWESRATPQMQRNYVWYVLHHSIDYKAAAFEGDQLIVNTWVTTSKGVKSERHYEIVRISDQRALVTAKTVWCLLDAQSHKPIRITDGIRNLF